MEKYLNQQRHMLDTMHVIFWILMILLAGFFVGVLLAESKLAITIAIYSWMAALIFAIVRMIMQARLDKLSKVYYDTCREFDIE